MEETFRPPEGVRAEAQRALRWMSEGHAGQNFTAVGRRRASQLAAGQPVSVRTLQRMRSYFARHAVDSAGKGYSPGEPGYPSPGRVAWAAWGGDAGRSWANAMLRRVESQRKSAESTTRDEALGIAKMMGCSGAHQDADGNWMPCRSHEEMLRISNRAETVNIENDLDAKARRRKRRQRRWERLRERPVAAIETLPDGGLVAGEIAGKRLGQSLRSPRRARRLMRAAAMFDADARDADGDGRVQDATEFERPASPRTLIDKVLRRRRDETEKQNLDSLLRRLKNPDDGFSVRAAGLSDVKSGWAISRNGAGVVIPASRLWDANGKRTPEASRLLVAFMLLHRDAFDGRRRRRRDQEVVLGGWHNPETGMVHFDVTDVYSKKRFSAEDAKRLGAEQRQISIADLDEIHAALQDGNWDRDTILSTGGDGGDLVDLKSLDPILKDMADEWGVAPRVQGNRVESGPEGVAMMKADPIEELARHHGREEDWQGIVAIDADRRKEIADTYDAAPDLSPSEVDPEVKAAYEALAREVEEQYRLLLAQGVRIELTDEDPYPDFFAMREDFLQNRRLRVMRTAVTGSHPFLTDEQNDMFRAVHDAFGHLATGRGFDRHGEEAAYRAHRTMFSPQASAALATETRGQNQFLLDRGYFGPQKLVLLSEAMRKALEMWYLALRKGEADVVKARRDSDADNRYTVTGSHHVTGGRVRKQQPRPNTRNQTKDVA